MVTPHQKNRYPIGHPIGTCTGSTGSTSAVSFLELAGRDASRSSVFEDAEVMALSGEPGIGTGTTKT